MTEALGTVGVRGIKRSAEYVLRFGFGLALIILAVIGVVSFRASLNLEAAAAERAHINQVRLAIQAEFSQLQDAESGQRGYLITGDDTYLAPYNASVAQIATETASLRALTAGQPAQQQRLDALAPLVSAKLAEMQQTIDLRRAQGFAAAQSVVQNNQGQQTMDSIRSLLAGMRAEEDQAYQTSDAALAAELAAMRWIVSGGSALALLLVLLALLILGRELSRRQWAEKVLADQAQQLAVERDLLQALMDHIPDTIYFKDTASRFTRVNRAQAQVLRLSDPAAAVGKTDFDLQPVSVSQPSFEREQQIMASGQPLIDWVEYVPTPEGAPRWFSSTKIPLRDAAGQVTGLVGLSRDITERQLAQANLQAENAERKRAEAEILALNDTLAKKVTQLDATNRELEAFSYSVSHDLRTPLRAMDGFSQILLEDYASQLDSAGQDYLNRVRAASQKMGELIDTLLALARLSRAEMRREPVDLTNLARAALAELQAADPQRQVQVALAEGLTTQGDPRLLRVVLDNLLGNAWKFTSKTPLARIEFGRLPTPATGEQTFFVRDNGSGFDMDHANRLFGAFQRLHQQSDFPGTGIGLATVQRVLNRHGGRAWAEGRPGQGATFFFALPATAA